jgi:hypothetical protein
MTECHYFDSVVANYKMGIRQAFQSFNTASLLQLASVLQLARDKDFRLPRRQRHLHKPKTPTHARIHPSPTRASRRRAEATSRT